MKIHLLFTLFSLLLPYSGKALTIAEKKASLSENIGDLGQDAERFLLEVNRELLEYQEELSALYKKSYSLYIQEGATFPYEALLQEIKRVRGKIVELENRWRQIATDSSNIEPYALWHQPETTIEQLVIDYGSQEYVYLIPTVIGEMTLSLGSNLPIPRSAWTEILELILNQNGVGVRQLNPFLRELYLLKDDKSAIRVITNKKADLDPLPPRARAAFVLSPDPQEVKRLYFFLNNFANHESQSVELIGRDILLVAEVEDIRELLKLADFVLENRGNIQYRAISLSRIDPDEMIKILQAVFNPITERPTRKPGEKESLDTNGLKVIKLGKQARGLFVVGTVEEIQKASMIIQEVEGQIGGAKEKVIHWYTSKYSDPDELADILFQIYELMIRTHVGIEPERGPPKPFQDVVNVTTGTNVDAGLRILNNEEVQNLDQLPPELYPPDPYFQGGFPIDPAPIRAPDAKEKKPRNRRSNFIVDNKTGAIVMVVEADILPRIKELIKKLDVPKKMCMIEVLLFERRKHNVNDFGLDLLRIGSCATQMHTTCALFNDFDSILNPNGIQRSAGIFDFILSRKRTGGSPAFDCIYRFLMTQDDITINSNPSVITVNQTPAFIAIQDEQSINTGVFQVETAKGVTLENAFKRAQYGITLKITPTIHLRSEGDQEPYDSVTLVSDIIFDTQTSSAALTDDRPNVTRRKIQNEARVADGETIILGGLRNKDIRDQKQSIPCLGEIPGLGKLFSFTSLDDVSTEMYIFITPRIIKDPACDLERIRQEEMCRRPGDTPCFMACLIEAIERERSRYFEQWMQVVLGREPDRQTTPGWHNPDTCHFPGGLYENQYEGCGYDGRF